MVFRGRRWPTVFRGHWGSHFSRWRAMTLSIRDDIVKDDQALTVVAEIKYQLDKGSAVQNVRGELVKIWWGRGNSRERLRHLLQITRRLCTSRQLYLLC